MIKERRTRRGEERRGEEEKKNFNCGVVGFSSWHLTTKKRERRRKEKRGQERRGDRIRGKKEKRKKSSRLSTNFGRVWGGGRKRRKEEGSELFLSSVTTLNSSLLDGPFAGFFGFLLLSYALLSLLPSLLSSPVLWIQRTILLSYAALNCSILSSFMLFYPIV